MAGPHLPPEPGGGSEPGAGLPEGARRRLLSFGDVALVCGATLVLSAVAFVAALAAAAVVFGPEPPAGAWTWAMLGLFTLEAAAITVSVYAVLIRRRGLTWGDLGLRPTTGRWVRTALVAALACLLAATVVTPLIDPMFEDPLVDMYVAQLGGGPVTWGSVAALLLIGGLAVPVAEEVLFRGVIYRWLRQSRGIAVSVAASAAVFALVHANLQVAVQIFIVGAALAYLYERSGSLVPPIVTHVAINLTSLATILSYGRLWS